MSAEPLRCHALTLAGNPCAARPLASGLCFYHDPASHAARVRGGQATSKRARAERLLPGRLRPIVEGLERAFLAVEQGALEPRVGVAMAAISSALVRVFTAGELEEKVRRLDEQMREEQRQGVAR